MSSDQLAADGLVTVLDACKWLGVGRSTLYALIATNELPTVLIRKRRMVPRAALRALVDRSLVPVPA